MENRYSVCINWLKFCLNNDTQIPNELDWYEIFRFAEKHQLYGICSPLSYDIPIPTELLYEWIGIEQRLKSTNLHLNNRIVELTTSLANAGFKSCVLKGQGNATLYPHPDKRNSGDIDVWVDSDQDRLFHFVRGQFPEAVKCMKHIKYPIFPDVEVDIHNTPLKLYSPLHDKRLQTWIQWNKAEQFSHQIRLDGTDTDISIPTAQFNAVYQLGHIMIHLLDQGVGLRQLVDYYYVLKNLEGITKEEKESIINTWQELGMGKLAEGIMWIEKEMLGLPDRYVFIEPNEKRGKLIAADILEGGNFGKFSRRQEFNKHGKIARGITDLWRFGKLSSCFPEEDLFRCLSKGRSAVGILFGMGR